MLVARAEGVEPAQAALPGCEDDDQRFPFNLNLTIGRFGVSPSLITATCKMKLEGLDVAALAHFADRGGVLSIDETQKLVAAA